MAAFNILLASPLLSQAEKEVVKCCRGQFMHLRNRFPGSRVPSSKEAGKLVGELGDLKLGELGLIGKQREDFQNLRIISS